MTDIHDLTRQLDDGMDVYRHYIGPDVPMGKKIISPLRDEKDPSFNLFMNKNTNTIWFKDFGDDVLKGDHWRFVMEMFNINFKDAIEKIKSDILGYGLFVKPVQRQVKPVSFQPKVSTTKIDITPRDWLKIDFNFWKTFGISLDTCDRFNVKPLKSYTMQKSDRDPFTIFAPPYSPMYGICFPSGKKKIYSPFSKDHKWVSNLNPLTDVFGMDLLPEKGDILFLMAGNKDTMSFYEQIGLPAIALVSETANLSNHQHSIITANFKSIYVFYDNDAAGNKKALQFKEEYGFKSINHYLTPYNVDDFSQFIKEYPKKKEVFKNTILKLK